MKIHSLFLLFFFGFQESLWANKRLWKKSSSSSQRSKPKAQSRKSVEGIPELATYYIDQAIAVNPQMDEINLINLRDEIKTKVQFVRSPLQLAGSGEARSCGLNDASSATVYLNPYSHIKLNSPEGLACLNHEAVEALGYDDANYNLTMRIYLHSRKKDVADTIAISSERSTSLKTYTTLYADGSNNGGVTGAGGGGDGHGLKIKMDLMVTLGQITDADLRQGSFRHSKSELIEKVLSFAFEPDYRVVIYNQKAPFWITSKTVTISEGKKSSKRSRTFTQDVVRFNAQMMVFFSLQNYNVHPMNAYGTNYPQLLANILKAIDNEH
ncbi:MAG: hypothetical protein ACPGJV_06145 [Bacteriovoracaceae bacterium]